MDQIEGMQADAGSRLWRGATHVHAVWLRSISLRTVLALAVAVLAVVLFVLIADDVREGEAARLDTAVADRVARVTSPDLVAVMKLVTLLGSVGGIVVAVALVVVWTWLRRARALGGILVAVALVTEALNQALKLSFRRDRPEAILDIVPLSTYAFPSGHAMASTAVYGTIAIIVARLRPGLAPLLWIATPILVLAIGASRILLGMHWTTDVLAGFAAGCLVLIAGRLALGRIQARPSLVTSRSHARARSTGRSRDLAVGAD